MKAYVITNKGAEQVCKQEIKELIDIEGAADDTVVKFSCTKEDLCLITYKAQSISRAVLLITEFSVDTTLEKTINNFIKQKISIPNFLPAKFSAKVECERHGIHDFRSVDIGPEIGKILGKKFKITTEYDNPDIMFYLYINESKGYLGIDFGGFDLSKRQYKIFNHPESLKGITGYVLVRESGYKKAQTLIDPFMGSGVVVIEAALYANNYPVRYYEKDKLAFTKFKFFKDSFYSGIDAQITKSNKIYGYDSQQRYLKATQKNAKLAGIKLNLSKSDVEWLDTRFEKSTVDCIVSDGPRFSKHKDIKVLEKVYNELFYQASYILKKNGTVALLTNADIPEKSAQKNNFKLKNKKLLYQGKEKFNLLVFAK